MTDSIDQVIRNGQQSWAATPQNSNPSDSASFSGINKTPPLPLVMTAPGSPRKEHKSASVRSNSRATRDLHHGGSSSRREEANDGALKENDGGSESSRSRNLTTMIGSGNQALTDFFSSEVFQLVIHNPTTAHRFLRFCQSRACGENMEFLQKVDKYNRLLDDVSQALGGIHAAYTSPDAPRQINISHYLTKKVSADIKHSTQFTLPSLENIFVRAQEHVEKLLASDIYPRFVKHQITASATAALSAHRERFQGLGDCFCLTDPSKADNPILFASDGFVSVTGYTRKDIIPRNCRFLQGDLTDSLSTSRLRESIRSCEETVELLLNYRKNGDPFWNLLYVSPLFNEKGEVSFFLGGQINCSTTIHSCTDVLRVLSINDDELDKIDEMEALRNRPASVRSRESGHSAPLNSSFFKSWRKYNTAAFPAGSKISVRDEAGMEGELINKVGKLSFKTQVEAFYTAYSKYLVMAWSRSTETLIIQHYSPGVIDMLCLNLPNGGIAPIFNKDVFRVLAEHSSSSTSVTKALKQTVRDSLRTGKAVSVETGLLTGFEEKKSNGWFGADRDVLRRVEEKYVTHWTPLKDEEGRVKWVVLTIAPKA